MNLLEQKSAPVPVASADRVEPQVLHQAIFASALGNAVEWFDYAIYAYVAVYVAAAFFPTMEGSLGLLGTFGILAVSFFVRPLGGIILGPWGDRVGRQKVLVLTIGLMSVSTFLIGLLPSYETVGIWAPVSLLGCRLVQGFSTGGEYGGAAVFMAEYSPDARRGFYGSFLEMGTLAGTCAGALLCTGLMWGLGEERMYAWGWRIPFLLTLPLGLLALLLRSHLQDPPAFAELEQKESSVWGSYRQTLAHWRPIVILMGFVLLLNVAYYTVLTFLPSYLSQTLHQEQLSSHLVLIGILLFMMIVIAPLGAWSDRIGRKPLLYGAGFGFLCFSLPLFWLISRSGLWGQILGVGGLGLLLVTLCASVSSTLPALFPTQVRYGAFAIGYNLSTLFFGGTAPVVLTYLIEKTGSPWVPAFYLMAAALAGLVAIYFMPETAGASLRGRTAPGVRSALGGQLGA